MLERSRVELSKSNNSGDKELADALGARIKKYGDFSLSSVATPASTAASTVEKQTPLDLRQKTYELLSMVREPNAQERKSLTDKGFIFLPIEAKTLVQVVGEHPDHFWSGQLQYINGLPYDDLRTYVPKPMEVAFNPRQLFIPDSFTKTQAVQLRMTEEYTKANFEKELPDAKALMLPATVEAQADIVYHKMTKGQVLFRDRFARALDRTADSIVAHVGRDHPDHRLHVHDGDADDGRGNVGVPLAVVFLRK